MNKKIVYDILENNFKDQISNFTILQVGANDGIQDDLIRDIIIKYKPKSYLIEPIKEYFDLLLDNYKSIDNIQFFNLAISNNNGLAKMTYVPHNNTLPEWVRGLGTLDENNNFFCGFGDINKSVDMRNTDIFKTVNQIKKKTEVITKKLNTFLNENDIKKIDVYITDTEGYDYIIFEQLDLNLYSPKIIIMETHSLGEESNEKIKEKLFKYNYQIVESSWDTIAIKI
jgi:FkbM family methyltransferase